MRKILCALALLAVCALPVKADDGTPEKVIYLTFDDGPGAYTDQLLDILKRQNVQATFFLVNTGVKMEHLLNRMVEEGHCLGVHSYRHDFQTIYASDEALMQDIYAMQDKIYDLTGVRTWLFRFPGGSSNTVSRRYCYGIMSRMTKRVAGEGFCYFDWNVDSGDAYGCPDPEVIYQKVICGIKGKNCAVVLQHDLNKCSVQTVERIIQWGKENGYVFRTLTMDSPICHHRVQN